MKYLLGPLRELWREHAEDKSRYNAALEQSAEAYDLLLEKDAGEPEIHRFLEQHPFLLLVGALGSPFFIDRVEVFSKVPLGESHIADFAVVQVDSDGARWTFIEIEKPTDRLFTKEGDPSAKLKHGLRQLQDWRTFIHDNHVYVRSKLQEWHQLAGIRGPDDIWRTPTYLLIMGRDGYFTAETRRRRASMNDNDPRMQIATFDRLRPKRWGEFPDFGIFSVVHERGQLGYEAWPSTDMSVEFHTKLSYFERLRVAKGNKSTPQKP